MARPTKEVLAERQHLADQGLALCRVCGETKPLDEMAANNGKFRTDCKTCRNAYMRAYSKAAHEKDPEKIRARYRQRNKRYRTLYPEKDRRNMRQANLKRQYGITIADWDAMFEAQGGRCAICRAEGGSPRGRFHVDHHHGTGKVRALLCQGCNHGLGKFKEDVDLMRAAIAYLEEHTESINES